MAHAQEPVRRQARVEVQLAADDARAGLYRLSRGQPGFDGNFNGNLNGMLRTQRLCDTPCRLLVEPGEYMVWGPRLRQSPTFAITGQNRLVRVDAEVGTEGGAIGGIALAAVGGFTLLIALPITLLGVAVQSQNKGSGLLIGGAVATAAGAGLLIGGISMIVGSKTTIALQTVN
ncbi:MAG TPA: hypothetical protein VNG33_12255 [Polyangiaceae bacterium]|nr:hypothetical protein [Polyangiaceae bacterium]